MRIELVVFLGLVASVSPAGAAPAVRVWVGAETIPTYEEGPPDPNPPFDLFTSSRFNYPYTLRENLTDRRTPRIWRTLNLENEFLRVAVLPDLGGRLWRCVDKVNGASLFYANPSLKFAQVAYRGAWATFGIEWNFPVSHNWVTSSPVDFATVGHRDGSASIVVGNIDLVYGMQWRVELTLRPGRAVLEQATTLYNRSDLRHRFYWWTNAAVEAWDDSQLVYPMAFTASHGFTQIDTWPVNAAGVDLSRPGHHLSGPVSLFSHGSREPFMGVYHPRTQAGVAHWADPAELPAKKVWSWGADADGRDWRKALSDNDSAEVEIQAGLFRNQETYGFLDPQETVRFRESWMPVRQIGGLVRATPDAVLNVERARGGGRESLVVGLNVTRAVTRGRLRIKDGPRVLVDEALSLDPAGVLQKRYPGLPSAPRYTIEALDDEGQPLVVHTEGLYDEVPPSEVAVGPQAALRVPATEARTEDDWIALGDAQEREGKLLRAYDTYEAGLARFGESFRLNKAAGRLALALKRYGEATSRLARVEARVTNDAEVQYSLGVAWSRRGDGGRARAHLERALGSERTRPAALLQIARSLAAGGDLEAALARVRAALRHEPRNARAGTFEVILLRRLGRPDEAKARLAYWKAEDPTLSTLRNEDVTLGGPGEALWAHLAGDPQRVIEAAIDYMDLGAWDDAVALLARDYPSGEGVVAEPGMPSPQAHPEVAYYRGYCREAAGRSGRGDFDAASSMSTTYVFPQRAWTLPVLERAIAANPRDATAHFLLGSLFLSGGIADRAVAEWQEARRLRSEIPGLHRNLGLTLLHALGQPEGAREVFAEGIRVDPDNAEVYQGLDQVLGLLGRPADERVRALAAYPHQDRLPGALVFKQALALVEAGRTLEAEALFGGRFFAREEFGTNVRQVWVEVEVQKARALARGNDCAAARRVADGISQEVPGLTFTKAGLEPFAEAARTHGLIGDMLASCGDDAGARSHWEKAAAAADAYPQANVAFAHRAAKRLGRPDTVMPRVEAALEAWANRLAVGTNFPGANATGQGLFLRELGREAEAQAKLREALLLPDKVMSHYLSREALTAETLRERLQ